MSMRRFFILKIKIMFIVFACVTAIRKKYQCGICIQESPAKESQ